MTIEGARASLWQKKKKKGKEASPKRAPPRPIDDDHVRHPRAEAHLAGDLADEPATAFQVAVALGGAERPGGRLGRAREEIQGQASAGQAQEQEQGARAALVAVGPPADLQRRQR